MTQKTSYLLCVPWVVCSPLLRVGDPKRFRSLNRNQRPVVPPHHFGGVARRAQSLFCLWVPDGVPLCVRSSTQPESDPGLVSLEGLAQPPDAGAFHRLIHHAWKEILSRPWDGSCILG